jgi:hypothetical protein
LQWAVSDKPLSAKKSIGIGRVGFAIAGHLGQQVAETKGRV